MIKKNAFRKYSYKDPTLESSVLLFIYLCVRQKNTIRQILLIVAKYNKVARSTCEVDVTEARKYGALLPFSKDAYK